MDLHELPPPLAWTTPEEVRNAARGFGASPWVEPKIHPEGETALFSPDQLREYALEAVRRERERMGLPKSYGGSTLASWGDQKEGCTVRLQFTDAKEAEAWFNRLTDQWDRSRSMETSNG